VALAKLYRLRHWRDFQFAYQQGRRYSGQSFTLFRLKQFSPKEKAPKNKILSNKIFSSKPPDNKPLESKLIPTRLGVSISQKVSKKAVVRNRLKRQILGGFQTLLPNVAPGWRLVIVVKPGAVGCNYADFLRELKQLLIQAEVLNGY
jgi:ribonuclease P protein component